MAEKPFVSIISPVRNAERTMDTTLQYLLNVDYPRDKMEIILADGGSTDNTKGIIKKWMEKYNFIKIVDVPDSKSPGHARNAAMKVAKGEYICFTDGDCAPHKDWIDKLIEPFMKDDKIGMVGGEIYTLRTDANNATEAYCEQAGFLTIGDRVKMKNGGYYPEIKKDLPSEVNGSQTCPFFATANVAVSMKAAQAVGLEFWHEPTGEDVDFNLRILKKGFRLFFQPSAIVDHMHRASPQQFFKQLYGYGYGHPLLLKMHSKKVLEFYFNYFGGFSFSIPWPVPGIIYVGDFMMMWLTGIATVVLAMLRGFSIAQFSWVPVYVAAGLWLFFNIKFFLPVFKMKPISKIPGFMYIHYMSKWNFIKGGLDGQKKFGTLNVEG